VDRDSPFGKNSFEDRYSGLFESLGETSGGSVPSDDSFWLFLPDGSRVKASNSLSTEEAYENARKEHPDSFPDYKKLGTKADSSAFDAFFATANRTTRGLFPGIKAAFAAAVGDEEGYDAAQAEIAEATLKAAEIAPDLTSLDDIKNAWDNDGAASAVGKAFEFGTEQIFSSFGYQVPSAAAALGGYGLGAIALAAGAPVTGAALATLAGLGAMYATFLSSDLERAYVDGGAKDTDDLRLLGSMAAAGGQTALNSLSYLLLGGGSALKGVLGSGLTKEGKDIAMGSFGKMLNKLDKMHPVKQMGAVLLEEEVAEVGQQALERMAAGLPVSPADEGARDEYIQIMLATLAPGVGFGAGKVGVSALSRSLERVGESQVVNAKRQAGIAAERNSEIISAQEEESVQEIAKMIEEEQKVLSDEEVEAEESRIKLYRKNLKIAEKELRKEGAVGRVTQKQRKKIEAQIAQITKQIEAAKAEEVALAEKVAASKLAKATEEVEALRDVTPDDIHSTADARKIRYDDDAGFMSWMAGVTGPDGNPIGKYRIDDLNADERRSVISILEKLPVQSREISFSGVTPGQAESVFREAFTAQKDPAKPLLIAKSLKIPNKIKKSTRDAIVEKYFSKMQAMGLVKKRGESYYANSKLDAGLTEQYAKVEPLIKNSIFPSTEEIIEKTDIRDRDVIEELRLASVVRGAAKPSDKKLSDTSYSVLVDGQVVGDQKYSTLTEAQEAADSLLSQDTKSVERYEAERRVPSALRVDVPDRDISITEETGDTSGVSEVEYTVSSKPVTAYEIIDANGNRVALRSSKNKANKFISGTRGGRVDVFVNGEKIASARTYPEAQRRRKEWIKSQKDLAYSKAYAEVENSPTRGVYAPKFREADAKAAGREAAEALDASYDTKFQHVPSEYSSRKLDGFSVSEKLISPEGRSSDVRVTEIFPTREEAHGYISQAQLDTEGPFLHAGKTYTSPAKRKRIVAARTDPEVVVQGKVRRAEARTAPLAAPVQEFPAEAIPALPTAGLDVGRMTDEERKQEAISRARERTIAETGEDPIGPFEGKTPIGVRRARLKGAATESVIEKLDQYIEDFEAGKLSDAESESFKRKRLKDEARKRIIDAKAAGAAVGDLAEWISDLELVVGATLKRVGVPVRLKLYEKKGNQESGAEFLMEAMLIKIGVDADLAGKTTAEQFAAIAPYMNHELIHVARQLGLIKASEWRVLSDYVASQPFPAEELSRINASASSATAVPSGTYLDVAKSLYGRQARHQVDRDAAAAELAAGDITKAQHDSIIFELNKRDWIADDFVEEAVAFAFQHFTVRSAENQTVAKKSVPETEVGVVRRIMRFFRELAGGLRRRGITNADEIFNTFRAEGEFQKRLDRGKALDIWYLRRTDSGEFNRLREFARTKGLEFPNLRSADRLILEQAKAEGDDESVIKEGKTPQEFAIEWITDARKTSPETRKAIDTVSEELTTVEIVDLFNELISSEGGLAIAKSYGETDYNRESVAREIVEGGELGQIIGKREDVDTWTSEDWSNIDDIIENRQLGLIDQASKILGIDFDDASMVLVSKAESFLIMGAVEPAPTPRAEASPENVPWSTKNGTPVERAAAFDALPEDAEVTLFHATSEANAENIMGRGTAEPQRQGRGIEAADGGIYVGTDPISIEGMGPRILAVTVRKSQVSPSSEYLRISPDGTAGSALVGGAGTGGVVRGTPIRVEDVTDAGRYTFAAESTTQETILNPVPAPESADPRGLRKKGEPGDLDSYTWGDFAFNRFGEVGKKIRVIVPEGYVTRDKSSGKLSGMGAKYLETSLPDIQKNTQYSNWQDLVSNMFGRISKQRIDSGEFVIVSDDVSRVSVIWTDPGSEEKVVVALDYAKGPNSDVSGSRNADHWNVIGIRADGGYSLPGRPFSTTAKLRGDDVSALAVAVAERPDLATKLSPREERRYALDKGTEKLTDDQQRAVDKIMEGYPNPRNSLWDRATSGFTFVDNELIDWFRRSFFDKYNRLWTLGYMIKENYNPSAMMADTSAHAAAQMIERTNALYAGMLETGSIYFGRPKGAELDPENFDGTTHVRPLELDNEASNVVVGFNPETLEPILEDSISVPEGGRHGRATGGLIHILRMVGNPHKKLVREFFAYSRAVRALRLRREGRASVYNWSDREIAESLALAKIYPEIAVTHHNLQKWNDGLVNYAEATQVITPGMAAEWKQYRDYTPFLFDVLNSAKEAKSESFIKLFEDEFGKDKGFIADSLASGIPVRKLKSAPKEGDLLEPIEAISRNTVKILSASLKNVARNRAIRDAKLLELAEKRDKPGRNTVEVRRKGEVEYYYVADPMLMRVLEGSFQGRNPGIEWITKMVSIPANLLREGVTRSPDFILRNIARDSVNAWGLGVDIEGGPLLSTLGRYGKNLALQFKDDSTEEYKILQNYGAVGGYELIGLSPRKLRRIFASKVESKAGAKDKFWNFWDFWGEGSARSESAVREQVFLAVQKNTKESLRERGYTDDVEIQRLADSEAAFQAMEILNFSRRGSNPALQIFLAGTPFLNARMQGLDRLYRAYLVKESPDSTIGPQKLNRVLFTRAIMLGTISGALAIYNYDDEDYNDQRREAKDDNWMLKLPHHLWGGGGPAYFSVPIPFEMGIMFKLIPEQITRLMMKMSDGAPAGSALSEMKTSAWRALTTTLLFDPLTIQAVKPLLSLRGNWDAFTQREIIPKWMDEVDPYMQSRDTTGEAAKALARASENLLGYKGISPINVEYLVRSYFGTLGTYSLMVANWITEASPIPIGAKDTASTRLIDYPVLRSMFKSDAEGGLKAEFYQEIAKEVGQVVATLNRIKDEEPEKASEYMSEYIDTLRMQPYVKSMKAKLKNIREKKSHIRRADQGEFSDYEKMIGIMELEQMEKDLLVDVPQVVLDNM